MSDSGNVKATLNISGNLDEDGKQQDLHPQPSRSVENKESSSGHTAMLDKTEEFFQICDSEGKGRITCTDMRVKSAQKVLFFLRVFIIFLQLKSFFYS